MANPDGIGIPKTAKDPAAAAKFIKWFTDEQEPGHLGRPGRVVRRDHRLPAADAPVRPRTCWPSRARYAQAAELETLLREHAQAPFPQGAPPWYAQFSNAVYTNIHQAAAGQETVQQAVTNIASQVAQLKASG